MHRVRILSMALLMATGGIEARQSSKKTISGEVINTQMNQAAIKADDVCYWHARKKIIRCSSGKVIKNPIQKESALTGTPGHLMGENYIGYVVTKPSTPKLMGSGKRIDFYLRAASKGSSTGLKTETIIK
jgi:hypothetical protein